MRLSITLLTLLAISGCASQPYHDTADGKFHGDIDVRWLANDRFLFIPNADKPFRFVRGNGNVIEPRAMETDGGSIPRLLWGVKGLSPWGYAPAYIVHDFLFVQNQCKTEGYEKYTFDESATIMAEGLKAIMEKDKDVRSYFVFNAIVGGVRTPIAKRLWEQGKCKDSDYNFPSRGGDFGELVMTISFE